jgi:hypothetical protein
MMKLAQALRALYQEQFERNQQLKEKIKDIVLSLKDERWHYEDRIKGEESFVLKIESGRFLDPAALEDFFACTLVVSNGLQVGEAERRIADHFVVTERRPSKPQETHKRADSFQFDDLRIYARLKENPALPRTLADGVTFEIQVKTFLQHAWSIATHDLVYKSDDVNWSTARIAYQIKAMLEHAELAIQEAESLSQSLLVAKLDRPTKELREIITMIKSRWAPILLPENVKRLAENVQNLMVSIRLGIDRLAEIIDAETAAGRGASTLNLSPYGAIVQSVINQESSKIVDFLIAEYIPRNRRIMLPSELEWPEGVDLTGFKRAVIT